jgi:uncharacterized membrane protein
MEHRVVTQWLMRLPASILILAGILLITLGRHYVRRSRKPSTQHSALRTKLAGWTLTLLGFLAILAGFVIW